MDWTRYEIVLKVPFSPTSEMELQMPYDIKDMEARYELPDGTEFDNPQGNLHHRTERLEGAADFKLFYTWQLGNWRISPGVNLPVGDTVEDPFVLGDLGLNHQHIQFGTGTVDPLARVYYLHHLSESLNFSFGVGAQVPLVENRHGYHAPPMVDLTVGPRLAITDWLTLSASYSVLYQGRAYWSGTPDPNTGYTLQGIQVALPVLLGSGLYIYPSLYRAIDVDVRDEGDTFELEWIGTMSMEIPLGGMSEPAK
jgi:hypothetical protein